MPSVLRSLSKVPPSLESTTLRPAVRQVRAHKEEQSCKDRRYLSTLQTVPAGKALLARTTTQRGRDIFNVYPYTETKHKRHCYHVKAQWVVCVSLWIEKAVEVCYVHDKRGLPSLTYQGHVSRDRDLQGQKNRSGCDIVGW
jgi:hypothetical protein